MDLRRSVLCGELNWDRAAVADGQDANAELLLGFDGPKPVATARLLQRESRWLLELCAVLPQRRRQGWGRAMADALAQKAREQGATQLHALAPRASAPFFLSCGFCVDHEDSEVLFLARTL